MNINMHVINYFFLPSEVVFNSVSDLRIAKPRLKKESRGVPCELFQLILLKLNYVFYD